MQMRIVQFFYFNEHVHKDTMILYSEKQHCTTFNHLLIRGGKNCLLNSGKYLRYLLLEVKKKLR